MSHLLFIRNEITIPPSLREIFPAPDQRIVIRNSPTEVQSALDRGAFDIAIVYSDSGESHLRKNLSALRAAQPELFVIVLAPEYNLSEETTAFDGGADFYFAEPLPKQSLIRLINRVEQPAPSIGAAPASKPSAQETVTTNASSTLHTLRDLSQILSFSLDYKAFTQHFILKLRDHISFSKIGIFLQSSAKQSLIKDAEANHLECIASIGLPADLIQCFQLSRATGIGREIEKEPRIIQNHGNSRPPFAVHNPSVEKEFAILGCSLAIPISDREGTVGIAVLHGPVTGRAFTDDELELLYVLMEELGLAICNSRLHSELAQHGQLIENVLHSMSSGALVCGESLQVLYANDAAKRFLDIESREGSAAIDFAELPPQIAGPIHRAVEKGDLPEPFKTAGPKDDSILRVSIFPFSQKGELLLLPRPMMIIIEDYTFIEANKQTAVDDIKSETIGLIAERFAHEIRNSLVPLSTHAQLLDKKIGQPKFQASLKSSLLKETTRIKRFSDQMLYMAQFSRAGGDEVDLVSVIEDAFERARGQSGSKAAKLNLKTQTPQPKVQANAEALGYALEEIFHNSMQVESRDQEITVSLVENNEGILQIGICDGGPGFTEAVASQATEPFFTTRNTGVGLGLAVAQKIVAEHDGFLRIFPRSAESTYDIEIELPLLLTTA